MTLRIIAGALVALSAGAMIAGQARSPAPPAVRGNARPSDVRVAVNMTTIESAPVFVAAEQSAAIRVSSGGIPQLIDRTADAATNAETQALLRSAAAPNIRIVLTVAECYYRLVARRSAGITRVADLRAKKVGTASSTSAH